MSAADGVALSAMRLHEKFGVDWTRRLAAALDRLAYVETGEGFTLSAHAPAGGVDVAGRHYVGGQFIPNAVMAGATPAEKAEVEHGAAPAPALSAKPIPPDARAKILAAASAGVHAFKAVGHAAAHVEHVATEFLSSGVDQRIGRLPPKWAAICGGVWWLAKLGTKAAFATYLAGQNTAQRVSEESGATPEQAARLRKILTAVDMAGAKAVPLALSAVGLGAFGAGAAFVPVGSAAYLAYSAAVRPLAVLRGAKRAVGDVMARRKAAGVVAMPVVPGEVTLSALLGGSGADADARLLLAALEAHAGPHADEFDALLFAALDECGTLAEAVEVAGEAFDAQGGDDVELSAVDEGGWLDPREYPPEGVDEWSEPTGFELSAPDASRYVQRVVSRGTRKGQAGWYDAAKKKFMPADWKPAGDRAGKGKAANPKAGAAPKAAAGKGEAGAAASKGKVGPKKKAAKAAKPTVDAVHDAVKAAAASGGPATPEDVDALTKTLMGMTVAQMGELKKRLGLSASGKKAEYAKRLAERALAGAKAPPKGPKGKPSPPEAEPEGDASFDLDDYAAGAAKGREKPGAAAPARGEDPVEAVMDAYEKAPGHEGRAAVAEILDGLSGARKRQVLDHFGLVEDPSDPRGRYGNIDDRVAAKVMERMDGGGPKREEPAGKGPKPAVEAPPGGPHPAASRKTIDAWARKMREAGATDELIDEAYYSLDEGDAAGAEDAAARAEASVGPNRLRKQQEDQRKAAEASARPKSAAFAGHPLGDLSNKSDAEAKKAMLAKMHEITGGRNMALMPLNPYGLEAKGEPRVLNAIIDRVADVRKKNTFARPMMKELYESARAADPELTVRDFQGAMRKLQIDKKLRAGPHTSNLGTMPDEQAAYAYPMDKEMKLYAEFAGDEAPQRYDEPAAPEVGAAPPEPEPAKKNGAGPRREPKPAAPKKEPAKPPAGPHAETASKLRGIADAASRHLMDNPDDNAGVRRKAEADLDAMGLEKMPLKELQALGKALSRDPSRMRNKASAVDAIRRVVTEPIEMHVGGAG